jgi:hypothetical protein
MAKQSVRFFERGLGLEEVIEEWRLNGIPRLSTPSTSDAGCRVQGCRTMSFVDFLTDIRRERLCFRHFKEVMDALKTDVT